MSVYADDARIEFDTVTLDRLRVMVASEVADEFAERVEVETWRNEILRCLVVQLRAEVLAERVADREFEVRFDLVAYHFFPRSPWQFFKQRHADSRWLGWFVRRRPVLKEAHEQKLRLTKRVRVEQFATFPMSPLRTPKRYRGPVVVRYDRVSEGY